MRFRVHLNSSYDRHASADFQLFPDDSSTAVGLANKNVSADRAVELLFRNGRVPQWVDLTVVGQSGSATILDVVACGRYTDDEERLYYAGSGLEPFSPKGPSLPVDYMEGSRFSVYEQSSCWSRTDFDHVSQNAAKVWSLELHGPAFHDESLVALAFPRLEILELEAVALAGPGFKGLEGVANLRHLGIRFGEAEARNFAFLPVSPRVETLVLGLLPPRLQNIAALGNAFPALKELTLGSSQTVQVDTDLTISAIERLTLEFPIVPSWIRIPTTLRSLNVHSPEAPDCALRQLLLECPAQLNSIGLRDTPASDALLDDLERFTHLEYLDAVDTRITAAALQRFAQRRTGFKCWPAVHRRD